MNAPASPQSLAPTPQGFQNLPLNAIAPSTTHIQKMRRGRFDKQALQDLADSIKATQGVLQPIVVRPHPKPSDLLKFEIVAGERRWIASGQAAFTTVPAVVRELDDEQVLEVQLVENLQREGLHEMEEAEGYEELMKLKKLTADEVADKIGKSRRYVFNRLKLLDLCDTAREAFYSGKINASVALYIARINHADTQRQALKDLIEQPDGSQKSARAAAQHIQSTYLLELKKAPFDVKVIYHKKVGGMIADACGVCPKRTGNLKDLFSDIKDDNVCTDPGCFNAKREAANALRIAKAKESGQQVIAGKEAKGIFPYGDTSPRNGFDKATDHCWDYSYEKNWKQLLGSNMPEPILVEHPEQRCLVEVYRETDLHAAAKAAGIKKRTSSSGASMSTRDKPEDLKRRIAVAGNVKVFTAVRAANRARTFGIEDLRLVVQHVWDSLHFDGRKHLVDIVNAEQGIPRPKTPKGGVPNQYIEDFGDRIETASAAELNGLLLDMVMLPSRYNEDAQLDADAKRLGIDPAPIRQQVKDDITAREKAKKAATKKPGKGKSKAVAEEEE